MSEVSHLQSSRKEMLYHEDLMLYHQVMLQYHQVSNITASLVHGEA